MSKQKAKGTRYENEVRDALQEFDSYRSAEKIGCPHDVEFTIHTPTDPDHPLTVYRVQCKRRAKAWQELYKWLEGADFLALRADNKRSLVVMPIETFIVLLRGQLP